MRKIIKLLFLSLVLLSCESNADKNLDKHSDWKSRKSDITNFNDKTFDLTITISIRNVSMTDSVYILNADYYNTVGMNVRRYLKDPIFLQPMETVEIIIEDRDMEGGSGANFIFDWAVENEKNPPLFEAVMISPYEQQGLAFSTRGVRIFE